MGIGCAEVRNKRGKEVIDAYDDLSTGGDV